MPTYPEPQFGEEKPVGYPTLSPSSQPAEHRWYLACGQHSQKGKTQGKAQGKAGWWGWGTADGMNRAPRGTQAAPLQPHILIEVFLKSVFLPSVVGRSQKETASLTHFSKTSFANPS